MHRLRWLALAAVLLGFSSATQDIVIDAFRIESAEPRMQALLSSTYIAGYRVAMLVAGCRRAAARRGSWIAGKCLRPRCLAHNLPGHGGLYAGGYHHHASGIGAGEDGGTGSRSWGESTIATAVRGLCAWFCRMLRGLRGMGPGHTRLAGG